MSTPAPIPGSNVPMPAPIPTTPARAPLPGLVPTPAPFPVAPPIKKNKSKSQYDKYVDAMKSLGFERAVIIKRDNYEMLSTANKYWDDKEEWKKRIIQQSVLNGRQKLVVLSWFRKIILERDNIFKFQSNWAFPPYILNIITLHYLENIDDKQQLIDDWTDNYKPCFYFFGEKWNILLRESYHNYQSLCCLKGKECVIAKQCKTIWIIAKVRVMPASHLKRKYQWMSYRFASAPQAYNQLCLSLFDTLEENDI